ncbi:MAG: LamG domain-containing protein [Verrucomicrobia bacterium]|nr:LamG domain-containing protein [Verrucomicrobiota bacterium]
MDGLALEFSATNQTARLVFPAVTDDARTNLTFPQGAIRLLYQPAWSGRMPAVGPPYGWGRGPGQRASLFTLQATQDGKTTPLLALSVDPDGTNLVLEAREPDGTFRTNRQAALRWLYPQPELDRRFIRPWREIAVSWSPTQTSLMVDGLLVLDWSNQRLTGPGVGSLATRGATLHFTLGSDANGDWPAQGLLDEVETYARALTPWISTRSATPRCLTRP